MMRHYIAYHKTERMGPLEDADALCVWTSKAVAKLHGGFVWLIVGEGSNPRRYTLASVFHVTEAGSAAHPDFKNCVRGSGHVFRPRPNLRGREWFTERTPLRFRYGLARLKDEQLIEGLRGLACEQGYALECVGIKENTLPVRAEQQNAEPGAAADRPRE